MKKTCLFVFLLTIPFLITGQSTDANLFGDVKSGGEHIPFANVYLKGTKLGTVTDASGHYLLTHLPEGEFVVVAAMLGYRSEEKTVFLQAGKSLELNFILEEQVVAMEDVVVTGTRTQKRKTDSPVIVNIIDSRKLNMIQAGTVAEGLCFQPGLRMETDCQTCNYTQLRMNGLGGSYSQILINSRPVFSPLTGLYGLEQIPSNMVERIEIVRGGGSALYGSSAIAGTVNIITKTPDRPYFDVRYTHSLVGGSAQDRQFSGNTSVQSLRRNSGVSLFAFYRDRDFYDHNGDGFSEMPELRQNSFGVSSYLIPFRGHKLEVGFTSIYEYRRGGDRPDKPAYLAEQSEERVHQVLTGSVDYSIRLNDRSEWILYSGFQHTLRDHYTGIQPERYPGDSTEWMLFLQNPPYGNTHNTTLQAGSQFNFSHLLFGLHHLLVSGWEILSDQVEDAIDAYEYRIQQHSINNGFFLQSDLKINEQVNLLTGVRFDKHNLVSKIIANPRISILYKPFPELQWRVSGSKGFRAPQAFDSDLHIAFAGGGIQRIQLQKNLKEEISQSLSVSMNYDRPRENYIYGFTLEGFYTRLINGFILEEAGILENGNSILEKRNGTGSFVQGITLELRGNAKEKYQLETGLSMQKSRHSKGVAWSESIPGTRKFLRSPERYGYFTLSINPVEKFSTSLTGVYTGSMLVPHYGVPGQEGNIEEDELFRSPSFMELNLKVSYYIPVPAIDSKLEISAGIQNLLDAYQNDFDRGKYRDSNYIYGPARPRTYFAGLRISSL